MRLRGLLRAEQRKSNRDQLSAIRPIILIPCPPNDRLHFQPGSLLYTLYTPHPDVVRKTSENVRRSCVEHNIELTGDNNVPRR